MKKNSVSKIQLNQRLYAPTGTDLIYVSNAKSACSTIKKSLWTSLSPGSFSESSNPHDRQTGPFDSNIHIIRRDRDSLSSTIFFTAVRNPYERLVSAYIDKVLRPGRDFKVWELIASRYGLNIDSRPSLLHMLELVTSDDPCSVDQHFAPQWVNTMVDYIDYDFIGHVEDLSHMWCFLSDRGISEAEHRKHATKASDRVSDFIGDKERALIEGYYSRDFDLFGYDLDPMVRGANKNSTPRVASRDFLQHLLFAYTAPNRTQCEAALRSLETLMPSHDTIFSSLEFGPVSKGVLMPIYNSALSGEIRGWRTLLKISQRLAENEAILESARIMDIARSEAGLA